jgi:glycosyltransferase involved in cell wall biosynthesis
VTKPRVLLLSQAPGVGGGERSVLSALSRAHDLDVTVAGHAPVCAFAESLGLDATPFELPVARRLAHAPVLLRGALRVRRLVSSLQADLVYANGIRATVYAVVARLFGRPPLLVHHHGQLGTGPARPYIAGIRRCADALVVDSAWTARPFGTPGKLHVVPNGVDVALYRAPKDRRETKASFGFPPESLVVGMLARAHPGKGSGDFLDIAGRVTASTPQARFLLAGGPVFPGEERAFELIRSQAATFGDKVMLTGYLSDPRSAYAAMDVFTHLGEPEGLAMSLLEAWSYALPVVAYRWGAVGDAIAEEGGGVLVQPSDVEAASDAVIRLLNEPDRRIRLGGQARTACEQRYSVEAVARTLTDVVVQTIGKR